MKEKQHLYLILTILSLTGCGGRVARPVAVAHPLDEQLSCAHLAGEYDNNNKRLTELTGEKQERTEANVGFLLVSPLLLDLSDTLREEATAIAARNVRLTELMEVQDCPQPPAIATSDNATAQ